MISSMSSQRPAALIMSAARGMGLPLPRGAGCSQLGTPGPRGTGDSALTPPCPSHQWKAASCRRGKDTLQQYCAPSRHLSSAQRNTPHLRFEPGLLLLKSLNSFHQERDLSEGQESCHVWGAHSHHPAVLVQHLEAAGRGRDNDLQGLSPLLSPCLKYSASGALPQS